MAMQSVEYNRFEKGIDRRKSSAVSDANRMRVLENAYVTEGWAVRKRQGLKNYAVLGAFAAGILQFGGEINTVAFGVENENVAVTGDVQNQSLTFVDTDGLPLPGLSDYKLEYSENFNAQLYVIASAISDGEELVRHFYNGVQIQDEKCPNSKSATKLASRIYAINDDVVSYSAVNDPLDWTTTNDAGFLPTGLQTSGETKAIAVGEYDGLLAVFMSDSIQLWAVDPDPALHRLQKVIRNIGTNYPKSIAQYSNDALFLSSFGFRSISRQAFTDNVEENDIGTPIDTLVRDALKTADESKIKSIYYPRGGQYWSLIGESVFVFTYSRSSKVNAWSVYKFKGGIDSYDDIAIADGDLFFRKGSDLFILDEDTFKDGEDLFKVSVRLPYLNQKSPGVGKRYIGFDMVQQGRSDVSFGVDPLDESSSVQAFEVVGSTRPHGLIPLNAVSTEISPAFTNETDESFQLDGIVLYYEKLGVHV